MEGMTSDAFHSIFYLVEILVNAFPSDSASVASGMACYQILLHAYA